MLIPVYSIRRVASIPIPVTTTALEEKACAVDSGCLPEYMYKAICVHTVQQLYSFSNEYLFCICLLQLELSRSITDTAVIAAISTIVTQGVTISAKDG